MLLWCFIRIYYDTKRENRKNKQKTFSDVFQESSFYECQRILLMILREGMHTVRRFRTPPFLKKIKNHNHDKKITWGCQVGIKKS